MKHTILIFSQAMELGGVERSLLGLLDAIDYDRYDVDLFLMRHSGELMPYLNPKAKLLPEIPQYASRLPCPWRRSSRVDSWACCAGG